MPDSPPAPPTGRGRARAHLTGIADGVTDLAPILDRFPSREGLFDLAKTDLAAFDRLRRAESIGRPLGSEGFLDRIARVTGRNVKTRKRGRKAQAEKSALSP